jgi:S-adenosylmethionine synthetase
VETSASFEARSAPRSYPTDSKTGYLPPEHYLAHAFREGLIDACRGGPLTGQGPDGKLLVRLRDEDDRWSLEHVLVTIQQTASTSAMDIAAATIGVLRNVYSDPQDRDRRWRSDWRDVAVMVNPNGPLVEAGSDGDNGQTGRKLVMDFYGPRVPIGGGALSGKHLTHIDRIAAYAAREAAMRAVRSGADECLVRLAYAPNHIEPIDIFYEMSGRGERQNPEFFSHPKMAARYPATAIGAALAQGRHFFDETLRWNGCIEDCR